MENKSNPDTKRVFIAIEFNESIKGYLHKVQDMVKEESSAGNFTSEDNFHLTLKFIGEAEADRIEAIKGCIDDVALVHNRFKLNFDRLGNFPRGNRSIVWIGIRESELLLKLQAALEASLEKAGFPKDDKKFTAHITLVRQAALKVDFRRLKEKVEIEAADIAADKISLMESTRVDGRLRYIPIYVKELL